MYSSVLVNCTFIYASALCKVPTYSMPHFNLTLTTWPVKSIKNGLGLTINCAFAKMCSVSRCTSMCELGEELRERNKARIVVRKNRRAPNDMLRSKPQQDTQSINRPRAKRCGYLPLWLSLTQQSVEKCVRCVSCPSPHLARSRPTMRFDQRRATARRSCLSVCLYVEPDSCMILETRSCHHVQDQDKNQCSSAGTQSIHTRKWTSRDARDIFGCEIYDVRESGIWMRENRVQTCELDGDINKHRLDTRSFRRDGGWGEEATTK
jgi:hypothetical protein